MVVFFLFKILKPIFTPSEIKKKSAISIVESKPMQWSIWGEYFAICVYYVVFFLCVLLGFPRY